MQLEEVRPYGGAVDPPNEDRAGIRVCEAMARRGVLTRPIANVIVIMPPYCTTRAQVERIISALHDSISEVLAHQQNSLDEKRFGPRVSAWRHAKSY